MQLLNVKQKSYSEIKLLFKEAKEFCTIFAQLLFLVRIFIFGPSKHCTAVHSTEIYRVFLCRHPKVSKSWLLRNLQF